jgi:hypothetical protein
MIRRAFLKLLGLTSAAIAGVELGSEADATLQLYCGNEPVSEPLPVRFRYDSRLKVVLRVSETIQCDSAVLRAPQVGERRKAFISPPMWVTPADTLKVEWVTSTERAYETEHDPEAREQYIRELLEEGARRG